MSMLNNKCPIKFRVSVLASLFCAFLMTNTAEAEEAQDAKTEQSMEQQSRLGFRKVSIETFGQYTFQPQSTNGTQAESSLGGNGQTQLNFILPTMYGPGLGGKIEAEFLPKFSFVIGAQFKSLGSKYKGYYSTVAGSPAATIIYANSSEELYYKTWMLDFGFRARTPLFYGEIFGGLGLGLILPFQSNYVVSYDYAGGYGTTAGYVKSLKTVKNFNLGLAGTIEIGYLLPLTSRIAFGISLTVIFGTVSNANKTSETTTYYGDGTTSKTTREYRKSFSIDEAAAFNTANNGVSSLAIYESLNITDVGVRGTVSFRMF